MSKKIEIAFQENGIVLSLSSLISQRQVQIAGPTDRYFTIVSSLKATGKLVEPLMVFPVKGKLGKYVVLDGHWRLKALKELGVTETLCLIAKDDEAFTYNHQINHLAPIQENAMILRVLDQGVSEEQVAATLNVKVEKIRKSRDLLSGIHVDAVDILRDKQITAGALKIFKKVKASRQVDMAQYMVKTGCYSTLNAESLLAGTLRAELVQPEKAKRLRRLRPDEIASVETEQRNIEKNFRLAEDGYSSNVLQLTVASRYIERLLGNEEVAKYLRKNNPEICSELERIVGDRSLE